jgi:hypothetical protein
LRLGGGIPGLGRSPRTEALRAGGRARHYVRFPRRPYALIEPGHAGGISPMNAASHVQFEPPRLAPPRELSQPCGVGVPTVERFTGPTAARFRSASNGAHSDRCVGSVSACHTIAGLRQIPPHRRRGGGQDARARALPLWEETWQGRARKLVAQTARHWEWRVCGFWLTRRDADPPLGLAGPHYLLARRGFGLPRTVR